MLPLPSGSHLYSSHPSENNDDNHSPAPTMDSTTNLIIHSTNHFAFSFMNNLPVNASDNVAFSPWSMINLLGMILLGTVDKSIGQLEFYKTLDIPDEFADRTHEQLHETYKQISSNLPTGISQNDTSVLFEQANFILYNSILSKINREYSKDLKSHYEARIEDFRPGIPDSRGALHERINSLVNKITRGMIKDLADPSLSTSADLAMVLLNAAYFKGSWASPFERTYKGAFFNAGQKERPKEVDFMSQENYFKFAQFPSLSTPDSFDSTITPEEANPVAITRNLNCMVVELPYSLKEGKEFSMLLLLPYSLDGVESLQRKLNAKVLQAIYESMHTTHMNVHLPKFNLETKYRPKDTLSRLGLRSVFDAGHDLARMFESGPALKIDEIIHQTNIKVDEKGSEAASASMAFISYVSLSYPQLFKADHPFLFIIRHIPTNTPLFMGRVSSF